METELLIKVDRYLMDLACLLHSDKVENLIIEKIVLAGMLGNLYDAKKIYRAYHSAPPAFVQWPERLTRLQGILDYFQVKYPEPSREIEEALDDWRHSAFL